MDKLTEKERAETVIPELARLRAVEARTGAALEQVERIHEKLRQSFKGKDFCFSAQRNKQGEYEFFVDGEQVKV